MCLPVVFLQVYSCGHPNFPRSSSLCQIAIHQNNSSEQIMRGSATAITETCRCSWAVMTYMTNLPIIATRSICAWGKCKLVESVWTQYVECTVCLYRLVVQLIFTELCCVKQFISEIDPTPYTSVTLSNKALWSKAVFIDMPQCFLCSTVRYIFYSSLPSEQSSLCFKVYFMFWTIR